MGAENGKPLKVQKAALKKLQAAVNLNERAINILYNKFVYMYLKNIDPSEHPKIIEKLTKKGADASMKISLNNVILLKEF